MQHLLNKISAFKKELLNKQLFLLMDYDGTLAPIADTPAEALIPQDTKDLLADLSVMKNIKLAIVSGRELKDVKKMVGIPGMIYAGNHGLEIEGPGIEFSVKVPEGTITLLQNIKKLLSFKLGAVKGVYIEDKKLAIALHYRNAKTGVISMLKEYFNYAVQPYLMTNKVDVLIGKMVYEVRPHVDWNKGNAIMWLISKITKETDREILPIYIGDDITDESVFKCLENTGVTVFVGENRKTAAKHYLKDTGEVYEILKKIKKMLAYE